MKNTLYLPLKKEWYKMIESGEKKEDYREINEYWCKRLVFDTGCSEAIDENAFSEDETLPISPVCAQNGQPCKYCLTDRVMYETVVFSLGYTKKRMTFEVRDIDTGYGKQEWGATKGKKYFVVKLGKKIS